MNHRNGLPASYDDWRTDPEYGMRGNDIREREAEAESDQAHADCLTEMLAGIAAVAAENLKQYGEPIDYTDKDVVVWLGGVLDDLTDNLLWRDWGNASDLLPSDTTAWIEQIWREAKERK